MDFKNEWILWGVIVIFFHLDLRDDIAHIWFNSDTMLVINSLEFLS